MASPARTASLDDLVDAGLARAAVAFLADATPAQRGEILVAFEVASARQKAELRAGLDNALKLVPAPLRGRVRKLLR